MFVVYNTITSFDLMLIMLKLIHLLNASDKKNKTKGNFVTMSFRDSEATLFSMSIDFIYSIVNSKERNYLQFIVMLRIPIVGRSEPSCIRFQGETRRLQQIQHSTLQLKIINASLWFENKLSAIFLFIKIPSIHF